MPDSRISLTLSHHETVNALPFQYLTIALTSPDRIIAPSDLSGLTLPAGIDGRKGVVISGRAPVWLFAYLVHQCHPTAWVACYDPRLGAIITETHCSLVQVGQVIPINALNLDTPISIESRCPAIMVVGPPDSGKSVFSHALFQALLEENPDVYLQRAHWDGEGNWILELPAGATDEEKEGFKLGNKGGLTDRFFPYQGQAILKLREQKALVIVDVGGMVQPEKQPVLEACTHYIIISSKLEEVAPWHEFCRDRGNLQPLAVIHSTLESQINVHQETPFLEVTCGPWVQGQVSRLPEVITKQLLSICTSRK